MTSVEDACDVMVMENVKCISFFNIIVQQEFVLTYSDVAVQHVSHYFAGTPQVLIGLCAQRCKYESTTNTIP